jgi:hypothetical protein
MRSSPGGSTRPGSGCGCRFAGGIPILFLLGGKQACRFAEIDAGGGSIAPPARLECLSEKAMGGAQTGRILQLVGRVRIPCGCLAASPKLTQAAVRSPSGSARVPFGESHGRRADWPNPSTCRKGPHPLRLPCRFAEIDAGGGSIAPPARLECLSRKLGAARGLAESFNLQEGSASPAAALLLHRN